MNISKDKHYRTRDGREVRIYAFDGQGVWSVHGAVKEDPEGWVPRSWKPDGAFSGALGHACDLVEVKPRIKRTVWLNVYPEDTSCDPRIVGHKTRENAVSCGQSPLARVKIDLDCEEGEGL
jgi:hypothetical protein